MATKNKPKTVAKRPPVPTGVGTLSRGEATATDIASKKAPAPRPSIPASLLAFLPESAAVLGDVQHLERSIQSFTSLLRTKENADSVTLARTFVVMHFLNQCMELAEKEWSRLFERFKTEVLPRALDHDGVSHVPLTEGYRVGVSERLTASIRADRKQEAYQWLKDNGLGELIVGVVNASTLSATAKSLLEEENRDLPEALFNVAIIPGTSVTRTKK